MPRHKLLKSELLYYALEGAKRTRAVQYRIRTKEERIVIDKDIAEIERRIKLVEIAERKKP